MNNLIKVEGFIYRAVFKTEDEVVKWINLYGEEIKLYALCTGEDISENDTDRDNCLTIKKYQNWVSYIESYWERKEQWCLAYRDATTHGHQIV